MEKIFDDVTEIMDLLIDYRKYNFFITNTCYQGDSIAAKQCLCSYSFTNNLHPQTFEYKGALLGSVEGLRQ